MKNQTKYQFNEETKKYDVLYAGFDYMTFTNHDFKVIKSFDTEEEAKKCAEDCLSFND